MKIRTGFVSNSSSQSFLVQASAYRNVFALALAMLRVRNEDWDDGNMHHDRLSAESRAIRRSRLDPNTPVAFQCTNYDTYIVRCDDMYAVSTCNNHKFCDALDGLVYREITPALAALLEYDKRDINKVDLDELMSDVEFDLPYACFYWWPGSDFKIRKPKESAKDIMSGKNGCDKHKYPERMVDAEMPDGSVKRVCPVCEFGVSIW